MTPEKRERLEAIVAQNLGIKGFTFADFISNPGEYGGNESLVDLLTFYINSDAAEEKFTAMFSNIQPAETDTGLLPGMTGEDGRPLIGAGLPTDNKRLVVVKDAKGQVVLDENGNPTTVEIDLEGGMFPAENFVETFIQTLSQSDVSRIQNFALNMGYLDEEDLGNEVNGNLGIVTENFIAEVLNFANTEYEDWYEGSIKRSTFVSNELSARNQQGISYDINKFFGGTDYRSQQYNSEQILSREIFANAMDSFLTIKKSESETEDARIDKAAAAQIRLDNRKPTVLDVREELEDTWLALTGDKLSDSAAQDMALEVVRKWSPYVEALEAQDKSIRAGEVMNTYLGPEISTMPDAMLKGGKYVMFEELKPEFDVESPLVEAQEKLEGMAEEQSELSEQAQLTASVQQEYLRWMMGRK
jgi:hypothetical protein